MPTKLLLIGAALFQGLYGVAMLFLPDVLLGWFAAGAGVRAVFFAQQFGTALLGLAAINWIARGSPVGGIYGRPLVVGNTTFFTTNTLLLFGQALDASQAWTLWVQAGIALGFAIGFALLLFGKIQPRADRA